jgi:TRAP-type C4-dicarboxylate transport system permease small subunit
VVVERGSDSVLDRYDRFLAVRIFRHVLWSIDWVAEKTIIAIMALMLAIVSTQVFMRYALNSSIDWASETATLCFVWTVFLAMPITLRNGGHIVMEMVLVRLSSGARDICYRLMSGLSFFLLLLIAREATILTVDNWDETIPSLGLSGGLFFVPIALGAAHCAMRIIEIWLSGEPGRRSVDDPSEPLEAQR